MAGLPGTLGGHERRTTRPSSPYVRAWGSPAIVLRCGVPAPADANAGSALDVDGHSWVALTVGDDVRWRLGDSGRLASAGVEVTVPVSYDDQESVIGALTDALAVR